MSKNHGLGDRLNFIGLDDRARRALRSLSGFEGFDVGALLDAAEELPFPLPDNAWKNRNCCWLSWTTLQHSLILSMSFCGLSMR